MRPDRLGFPSGLTGAAYCSHYLFGDGLLCRDSHGSCCTPAGQIKRNHPECFPALLLPLSTPQPPMLAVAGEGSLAIDVDGQLYARGSNFGGELGLGSLLFSRQPMKVGEGSGTDAMAMSRLAAGGFYSPALKRDGSVLGSGRQRIRSAG